MDKLIGTTSVHIVLTGFVLVGLSWLTGLKSLFAILLCIYTVYWVLDWSENATYGPPSECAHHEEEA